ncbi:uncharacterized protein EI97DRAFT_93655 [Westerdykella ornata]|uniref:Uncharacterized protein n=1 Tax=Westerdykella ornata TaxID=318751 RepID=A0A6A6JES1_WESOR|nr:uncharacterized protein EI97DRAFT_93655 [Westerdykella ornata]KAF2274912.1 hypothetical protein EI97DRAFT_93655 [Westerdykella ornata]
MKSWKHANWNPFARGRLNGEDGLDASSHLAGLQAEREELREHANALPSSRGPTKPESTSSASMTKVASWPEEARPLKQHTWVSYLYLIGDVILALLPVYFILLGVAAIVLNGQPTKDNGFGKKVEVATDLGPTLFPIVFAAISGRSMKMIARYLAERGAKLSTLELLMASQSVWGTVESQLLMRRLTLVGANLLFLWAMSPLGGQASLRLLETKISSNSTWTTLRYPSMGPGALAFAMEGTYISNADLAPVNPIFTASILAPGSIKNSMEDAWGNVKIPRVESLNASVADKDGWITVNQNAVAAENYSSLVGIPVIGRPQDRDAKFNLETSYMTMDCQPFRQTSIPRFNFSEMERLVPGSGDRWFNLSTAKDPLDQSTFYLRTVFPYVDADYTNPRVEALFGFVNDSLTTTFEKRVITYASGFYRADVFAMNVANCSVSQMHLEATVFCEKDRCRVQRVRRAPSVHVVEELTPLEHGLVRDKLFNSITKAFGPLAKGSVPTEQFIFNTSTFPMVPPTAEITDNPGWMDLSLLRPEVFSRRLALVLNTYYQLSLAPEAYTGTLPAGNLTLYGPEPSGEYDLDAYLPPGMSARSNTISEWYQAFGRRVTDAQFMFVGAATNATVIQKEEIYACNYAWTALLMTAAGILLLIGSTSLVLKRKTLGPEMFGFVASMTYENPHVNIPRGGTMLDAMERARLLKDMEVRIGDVRVDGDVGHIAFAAGVPLRKLERSRTYV